MIADVPSPAAETKDDQDTRATIPWRLLRQEAKNRFGITQFRSAQRDVLRAVMQSKDTLAIMPTGSGKSLTYQLPALLLPRPVVVVSPLIALMQDQKAHAQDAAIEVEKLDSTLTAAQKREADEAIREGMKGLIYVTPERLENAEFLKQLEQSGVSLFVVDEAHTIAQWGHDFRPAYLGLGHARKKLGHPPVLALTATATPEVVDEILHQLHAKDPVVINAGSERSNLFLTVHATVNEDAKMDRLLQMLQNQDGIGIIYTASIHTATQVHADLKRRGIQAGMYHGSMSKHERESAQEDFMADRYKVMVATKAFGLGIDKPNIRFVYHYEFPDSLESYAQEAGRAGRDGEPANAVLLYRVEDKRIQSFFSRGRYPSADELERVMALLSEEEPKSLEDIAAAAEISKRHTQVILYLLREAKVVKRKHGAFLRKRNPVIVDGKIEGLLRFYIDRKQRDKDKLAEMMHYAETATCRRQVLRAYFHEDLGEPCGNCDNCVNHTAEKAASPSHSALERPEVTQVQMHFGTIVTTAPETLPHPVEERFHVSDHVVHTSFGRGQVVDAEGENLTVRFEHGGTKKLKASFVTSAAAQSDPST